MDEWHQKIVAAPEHENPFRAPTAGFGDQEFPDDHPESIRHKHLSHETTAKSIGAIHIGAGIICCVLALGFAVGELPHTNFLILVVILPILLAFGLFYVAAAAYQLKPWSRTPSAILSVAVGAVTCIGIPITAYFLFVMFGKNGQFVYSDEYKEVVQKTSQTKLETPTIGWVILGCFLISVILLLKYVIAY